MCRLGMEWDPKAPPAPYMSLLLTKVTVGEYIESLNNFYSEPLNRPIEVLFAMNWIRLKANGASEVELKAYEARLRTLAVKGQ